MEETVKRTVYVHRCTSSLGDILLASDGEALTGLWFAGQKHFPAELLEHACMQRMPVFAQAEKWLKAYFAGEQPAQLPPLAPQGTAFQREVWQILLEIPYGQTVTYGEIARRLAKKRGIAAMSAQAVGGAVGHNPISLMIPCHRVLGAGGSLTGYAGGIERKKALLALETASRILNK